MQFCYRHSKLLVWIIRNWSGVNPNVCGTSFQRPGGSGINKLPNRKYKLFDPKAESVASDQLTVTQAGSCCRMAVVNQYQYEVSGSGVANNQTFRREYQELDQWSLETCPPTPCPAWSNFLSLHCLELPPAATLQLKVSKQKESLLTEVDSLRHFYLVSLSPQSQPSPARHCCSRMFNQSLMSSRVRWWNAEYCSTPSRISCIDQHFFVTYTL